MQLLLKTCDISLQNISLMRACRSKQYFVYVVSSVTEQYEDNMCRALGQ